MEQSLDSKAYKLHQEFEYLSEKIWRRWFLKWGLILGFWTALGIVYSSQLYYGVKMEGMNHSFWRILFWQLLGCWYGWVIFTPLIHWLGKRFPLGMSSWKYSLIVHILAVISFAFIHTAIFVALTVLIQPFDEMSDTRPFSQIYWSRLTGQFHLELIVYGMILGVGYAFDYYSRYRERELRASQLESQLALAQLQVLKMQLHPHFLFNTLNGIAALVRDEKNKAAVSMLVGLSDLLRQTLENAGKQEVLLREELDFLKLYLDLQQMRFSDRLEVQMDIDPESLKVFVPNLILQPLVENAIRHGIAQRISASIIKITTRCENGMLHIKIYNDGPGLPENWQVEGNEGIGLANTLERLQQVYGAEYRFDLRNRKDEGVEAVLQIPQRVEAENSKNGQDE